jgi:hypothetical protein
MTMSSKAMVTVRLSAQARDGLRREAGRRQAEDGSGWPLSRVVEALLEERSASPPEDRNR